MKLEELARRYRIGNGSKFRLAKIDPAETWGVQSKERAQEELAKGVQLLSEAQERLYASDQWALLLIFQAMDAAGKDSAIKHVMSGVNPQGCEVHSFKAPSVTELDHDFLWRTHVRTPERGRIGIFNRSYYEEVLVVRVHQQFLKYQKLPPQLVTKNIWRQRFEDMNNFESYLTRNGIVVRKFFLHVSKEEQKRRFLKRLDEPEKHWKFSAADVAERRYWNDYMRAYEDMIRHTSTPNAPWYVVPADHKWFTRLVVSAAITDTLRSLNLQYPKFDETKWQDIEQARKQLLAE